jgi:hypothetical protein
MAFTRSAIDERSIELVDVLSERGRTRYAFGRLLVSRDRPTEGENDEAFGRALERKERAWLGPVTIYLVTLVG